MTTAPSSDVAARVFAVTHPFHPLRGQAFELVAYKSAWGEDRVYFYDQQDQLIALPAGWTNVIGLDPFVAVAEGRSAFRAEDLAELARFIHRLSARGGRDV